MVELGSSGRWVQVDMGREDKTTNIFSRYFIEAMGGGSLKELFFIKIHLVDNKPRNLLMTFFDPFTAQ